MIAKSRTINPRYPGAPAWMSDGRLFTDYKANCSITGSEAPNFDLKQRIQQTGQFMMKTDRSLTVMRAGSVGCVDTMVPELTKRVADWNGAKTLPGHAAGIGQGRLYFPGRRDLVDYPDQLAALTPMPGTFSSNPNLYVAGPVMVPQSRPVVPARPNRYSAPYGSS